MISVVIDASVVVPALCDSGPVGRAARARMLGPRLSAPELIDVEVASGIRRLALHRGLDPETARAALSDLVALPIERVPVRPLLPRCWELRHTVTVGDATYVALAEVLREPLLTGDRKLADAPGPRCEVELFHPPARP